MERYVQIKSIPFVDVLEIADQSNKDVLIDVDMEGNSKCFMYDYKGKAFKVVILDNP